MNVGSVGMTVGERDSITLWASRSEEVACLAISGGGTHCEILMDRAHVGAMRDHLPTVLADLDQWAAENTTREQAKITERRACDAAARAGDLATAAEATGADELAASLRAAMTKATIRAAEVNAAVRAFENARKAADQATEKLIYLADGADATLSRMRVAGPGQGD